MPAAPKSPTSRKAGASKAKGAVRAKSGCYTCRIRRKKCDERPNEVGQCETCVRLRVECLGFGTKRPEWLRESRNVVDLRDRIKTFLAAQGMIKGHSGSGSRNGGHEPPTLRLAADSDSYSASSESPPTPILSLSADSDRHRHHTTSSWTYNQPGLFPTISTTLRSVSPYASGSSQGSVHDFTTYHAMPINSSTSLASPANASSFSTLYHYVNEFVDEDLTVGDPDPGYGMFKYPTAFMPPHFVDELVGHYMSDVIDIQYILADYDISEVIFETVSRHEHSRNAVRLLASVHAKRFRRPETPVLQVSDPDTNERMSRLRALLNQSDFITEDAMAALHVVSSILFDGGQGSWKEWLQVANTYVGNLLARSEYHGPADALLHCAAKDAFVVKTAIWFDVLASVTTQKSPHFLEAIRAMFDPNRSSICDASLPPQYSMMSPMGCENHVVWALAETSELSVWKREQIRAGSLSVPELVLKASSIEPYLAPRAMYTDLPSDQRECSRYLASDIFRASARLYLRSVVSGDYPDVPEIKESVRDTLHCIQQIPLGQPSIMRSVVRSTVFSFFICGALAEESQRHIIVELIEQETGECVGNCSSIQSLLKKLWEARPQHPTRRGSNPPVEWRKLLIESHTLLV